MRDIFVQIGQLLIAAAIMHFVVAPVIVNYPLGILFILVTLVLALIYLALDRNS